MELGSQIRKYRTAMALSQEELAEKIYVTRQSISNWENGKNYPDIHSLLALSALFDVSLDELVKGDIDRMKEEISKTEIEKFHYYGTIFSILMLASVLGVIPLVIWHNLYVIIAYVLLYAVTMYFAVKVEKIKKQNNIHTYREIVAFTEGKRLDEITKQQEYGKRPYQSLLLALGTALLGGVIALLTIWIFRP